MKATKINDKVFFNTMKFLLLKFEFCKTFKRMSWEKSNLSGDYDTLFNCHNLIADFYTKPPNFVFY